MNYKRFLWIAILGAGGLASADDKPPAPDAAAKQWAEQIKAPGLENTYKVSDGLYRGARLSPEGAATLQLLGIKTVVSLRVSRSDWKSVGGAKLRYIQIPMKAWRPHEEDVVQFLRIAVDKNRQPVFVYCNHGADRTGMMCAVYHIAVCGWSKEEAINEMTKGPFNHNPRWWQVVELVRNLDVERIKREAGIGMMSAE